MTKVQKIWLWVFLAMFVVPEALFSFIILSAANLMGANFSPLYSLFIDPQYLTNHTVYLFTALAIEWLGMLGLLITSIKNKTSKFVSVLCAVILLWLTYIFFMGYVLAVSMTLP